jgi:CRP-like cAMP-binding protein
MRTGRRRRPSRVSAASERPIRRALRFLVTATLAGPLAHILATIGPDCIGVLLALGASVSRHRVIVRTAGGAYRLPSESYSASSTPRPGLIVLRTSSPRAPCVWPFMPFCRPVRLVDLTQEFIAQMLGVTRSRVSQAPLVLGAQRVLHQGVGRIHIVNHAGDWRR